MKTNLAKNSVKNNFHIPKACLHVKSICKSTHFFFFLSKIFPCFSFGKYLHGTYKIREQENNWYESFCLKDKIVT